MRLFRRRPQRVRWIPLVRVPIEREVLHSTRENRSVRVPGVLRSLGTVIELILHCSSASVDKREVLECPLAIDILRVSKAIPSRELRLRGFMRAHKESQPISVQKLSPGTML